ncbi:autotransporter domain-containing protein [Aquabacter sp. CN5-332]|uniref:autotransporter domain-containing protein n=1 Tax=Aquabacter sp. CN5-332 TaxID=3156608 RepID=UPI0032B3E591
MGGGGSFAYSGGGGAIGGAGGTGTRFDLGGIAGAGTGSGLNGAGHNGGGGSLYGGGGGGDSGGGGGGRVADLSGTDISGKTPGTGAVSVGTGAIISNRTYDFVGIGGGGGGGGYNTGGLAGSSGSLTLDAATLTVNRSILVGGAGGGAGGFGSGGGGGTGTLTINNGSTLTVSETLLIGGSAGGGDSGGAATGGNGGVGEVSVDTASSIVIGNGGGLIIGGAKGQAGASTAGGTGGSGTLNLSGALTFGSGATFTINSGSTFNLGNAVAGGTSAGAITGVSSLTNNGTINFNQSDANYTFSINIIGSGEMTKSGTGVLTLTGTNTFVGGTTINAGRLALGAGGALAPGGAVTLAGAGANFDISAASGNQTIGDLVGVAGSDVTLGTNTLTFGGTSTSLFAGTIGGTTGGIVKQGTGTQTLTGASAFTGATTISAGTLALSGAGSIASSSEVMVDGTLDISGTTSGATVTNLSGTSASGVVALGGQTLTVMQNSGAGFAGSITGSGMLLKQGSEVLHLSGDSSGFSGSTQVNAGSLKVTDTLGTTAGKLGGNVSVASGATLEGFGGTIGGAVTVASGGILSHVTPDAAAGGLTIGSLTLDAGAIINVGLMTPTISSGIFTTTGTATVNGTLNITDLPGYGVGVYRVFASGGVTDNGLVLGTPQIGGFVNALDVSASAVDVQVTVLNTSLQYWSANGTTRGGGGTWTSANLWLNAGGGASAWASQTGVFDRPAGIVAVDGTRGFGTLEFLTSGYEIQAGTAGALDLGAGGRLWAEGDATTATISAPIVGAGALTKIGAGTVILSGTNSYQGGTVLQAGTLRVSSDTNLGVASGGLTFTGGTLATAASFTTNRNVTLNGTGTFDVAGGTTLTAGGVISGAGALVQAGPGTLILTGANSYAGGTLVSGGMLQIGSGGTTGSIQGDVVVTGALAFNRSDTVTFGGLIAGTGSVEQMGPGTLVLTGANSYTGGTTVAAGTLVLGSSTAAGTGRILLSGGTTLGFTDGISIANALMPGGNVTFDLASGSATASGSLSGTGAVTYSGAGLISLTGDSSVFAGTTSVGGILSVNGTLGGSMNVLSGGTLKGNGTVGPTTVVAGGTIAPGNSIGTLTVNGPLTFSTGSIYTVEINPAGQSDLINVTGAATLKGATVSVTKAPGSYLPGTRYTILTAQGGVVGTFGAFSQDMPFIDLALSYDPGDVYLNVARNQVSFPNVAVTPNQISTAGAVEALGPSNALYNAVVSQTGVAGAQQAFNAFDGEVYPSAMSVFQNESLILRRAVLDRARVPVQAPGRAPLPYAAKAPAEPLAAGTDVLEVPGTPNAFWAQAFGAWGQIDGNGNAATISGNTAGVFVGYERTFAGTTGDWRLGFAAGYSSSSYQVDARSSFSSDNGHVAVYGGGTFGPLGLRLGAAYSWADISASRSVVFPGFYNALSADTSARTGQVFGEVGYGLSFAQVDLEPFAGLAYVNVDLDDFAEWGGPSALTSPGTSQGVTYSTLGARISVPFALGAIPTALKGTLAWQHAFDDTTPEALFAFRPGAQPFMVSGVPIATDAALVEAGLDMAFTANISLSLFYAGQLTETDTNNMLKGNFTLRF